MKNIFKFMGIALMASALMVSCSKDEKTDTPDNPQPPANGCAITWGGTTASTGVTDAYMYSSTNTVYILLAAAGLENDSYTFPLYRFGFDFDTDPQYGCALTAQYVYGQQYSGNDLWPTDAIIENYYQSQYDQTLGIIGDWWLDIYTGQVEDFHLTNAQFDATTRTVSGSITVPLFLYEDVAGAVASIENPTNDDYIAAISQAPQKNLGLVMSNLVFDAATQK